MTQDLFIKTLLTEAKKAGLDAAEVYFSSGDSFRAMAVKGEINQYTVSTSRGLSLRGLVNGKMGYASTEALDEDAISQLIAGVKDSASLIEDDAVQEIYAGDKEYPVLPPLPEITPTPEKDKLDFLIQAEKEAMDSDPRIQQAAYNMVTSAKGAQRIVNTFGLDLKNEDEFSAAFLQVLAKEGERVATGLGFDVKRDFREIDRKKLVSSAVDEALFMLKAAPVASGSYRVIIHARAVADFLETFCGIFSAENAQQGMSLLNGREGEKIASDIVTLMDDPLMPGGMASSIFDAEGVATYTKPVIENGVLTTLLHNLKTARKAGVKTTGNAAKAGYAGTVRVGPTNFYLKPGDKDLSEMMRDMGDGLVILDLDGLHAGADAVSGDFSLLAKGYTVVNGRKADPVEQITVAGNFYEVLKNIRAVGSDIIFPGGGVGGSSLDVGELSVAGK